ncbi:fungal-specific transcription factor domain-containing protein [Lipomyces orientalis]|uniref:Fungal-specific transcription factor domain-containing protein n=1 Tax=Lipomyces orientalis TaxID=1233043 RepID=A0ACC3TM67_9ASCO
MTAARTTTTTTATRNGNGKGRSQRSSIACKKCHASKIKCDVSVHGSPCSRCSDRGLADCELIKSRRGTYDRKERLKEVKARKEKEEREHRQFAVLTDITGDSHSPRSLSSLSEGPSSPLPPPRTIEPIQHAVTFGKPNWNALFEFFLDDDRRSGVDGTSASYLGYSCPVGLIVENQHSGPCSNRVGRSRNHKDIVSQATDRPTHLTAAKIAFLSREGCFTRPDRAVLDRLVTAYFDRVDPVLPIIQKTEFMRLYEADKVPWLLLQSVCFAASAHCSLNILCRECGGNSRESRMMFYRRAKSLFDFGHEKDRLTLVQSSILLSYWGGSPYDYWNAFSWLNVAVKIAESLGMDRHSPVPASDVCDCKRALWRRIWWVLVVRDGFCASLLGKPLLINTSKCAVGPLQLGDFEPDTGQGMYVIETAKLSMILRDIVSARSANAVTVSFVVATLMRLENWRTSLPSFVNLATCPLMSGRDNVFASALWLMYYYNLIYLHQMALPYVVTPRAATQDAVSQVLEIGSNLVTRSALVELPPDAFGSFFMAIVLLFTCLLMKTGDASLHKMQLNVCEMIVYQAQDCWDDADWILPLCDRLRQKLLATPPSATSSTKSETAANDFSTNGIELDSLFNSLGMHLTPASVVNREVAEPVESVAQGHAQLSGGETELTVFNEMDDLFADMDTFSNVVAM